MIILGSNSVRVRVRVCVCKELEASGVRLFLKIAVSSDVKNEAQN